MQPKYDIDTVNEYIIKRIPIPVRDFASDLCLIVIRSFDVNMSAAEVDELKSDVPSSQTSYGLGQEVKIGLEIVTNDTQGRNRFAFSGGLIGIRTKIDPTLCRADRLVGQVLGAIVSFQKSILNLRSFCSSSAVFWAFVEGCTEAGEEVVLLTCIEKHWRLVGKCFCRLSRLIRHLLDVIGANVHMYLTRKRTEYITDDHGYNQ
ncbi:eukaryotic translation initiation factor 2 subunit 3-like protein [Suillus plorans]|uniref:Eukaryotic translation initiation factor 2 subunit 3-like protein n=1 Tax=Suillus plorans TaxID=116603 RepID=A0A9P7DAE6_9AGAM|nr:eukaryotic translation initiation factor 2 subunit 3-like protein [Suillus plorans]KAG1784968.1 eukaryotic translation initiation factor 2 subunit 3-like protein [Suillus plorans]